ncbi:response regulator [Streptomyces sp. NPDC050703]|uniref:response regulator n=1 Tax=Streptomyces sp. NPDC050703 TaxID=3157218 RepID=UPI00341C7236
MRPDPRILVVDDHEDTLFALESSLASLKVDIVRATSGEEALKEVLRGNVGLVLLDLRMPGVSGLDVVRYMRRLEQMQHIPIVLITGFGLIREVSLAAFELGVADIVMKPVDPLVLRTKVNYLYTTHVRLLEMQRELKSLRTHLKTEHRALDMDRWRKGQHPTEPPAPTGTAREA